MAAPFQENMNPTTAITIWTRPQADEVEEFAASELQRYLAQMLAQDVVSRPNPQPANQSSLYLAMGPDGPCAALPDLAADLPADGYVLRGNQEGVLLQAPTPRGLLYAVYGLLKHLGARWFFPGPSGEFIPRLQTLMLNGLDVTSSPVVEQRGVLIRGTNSILDQWVDFAPKIGLNAFALETHHGVHRLPGLAAGRGLHLRLRRHFFPTILCSEDERTLHWEETLMKGYLQSLPAEIDSVHVRPADAYGARCTCPVDAPYSLADQVMRFTNRMARAAHEVRPGEEFPYVAYLATWGPPPKVEPGPGVTLSLAPIHRCFNHAINDPGCWINATYRYAEPLGGHLEYGPHPIIEEHLRHFDPASTFIVDYWVDASFFGRFHMSHWERRLPNNGGILQQDIQYYHSLGIPSIWTFVVFIDDDYLQRFTSPLIFQYGELLWNPEVDLRAGLRDFCRYYYGDESLAQVFELDELSDPRDVTPDAWRGQMGRMSRALQITREAAAGTQDDATHKRLTRLAAEQEHCMAAMSQYLQEASSS
jgi:hypothetical protein